MKKDNIHTTEMMIAMFSTHPKKRKKKFLPMLYI